MNKAFLFWLCLTWLGACQSAVPSEDENSEKVTTLSQLLKIRPQTPIGKCIGKEIAQEILCSGSVDIPPNERYTLHSKTEAFVENIYFIEGDFVQKGQTLLTLSCPSLLEKQRNLLETKAQLAFAQKDWQRKNLLNAQNASTQKAVEEITSQTDLLTARYEGLKSELAILGIDIKALEEKSKFQSQIHITSPVSGYVHKVSSNNGKMVQMQDELIAVSSNEHLHLELQVLAKDIPNLEKGQKVLFTLPQQSQDLEAEIVKINPSLDLQTRTLNVHCHISPKDQDKLKAGMFVNARIQAKAKKMWGLPLEAVLREGESYFVFVLNGDSLIKTPIQEVNITGDFVSFRADTTKNYLLGGAYYVE